MAYSEKTLWCDGCGREILWIPYVVGRKEFCCQDCAFGVKCKCIESFEWEDKYQNPSSLVSTTNFNR